jgi:hypothetical protein
MANPVNLAMEFSLLEGVLQVRGSPSGRRTIHAVSGGGGGSTVRAGNFMANNPIYQCFMTTGKGSGHRHGGPLPVGRYRVARLDQNGSIANSSYLQPLDSKAMCGRSGMLYHGRGPHGSDGCIVPRNSSDWTWLKGVLQNHPGGAYWVGELIVTESFMGMSIT